VRTNRRLPIAARTTNVLNAANPATTRKTERHPKRSTSAPATKGPAIDGTTHAVANSENTRVRRRAG
jgi:hypothetical protein